MNWVRATVLGVVLIAAGTGLGRAAGGAGDEEAGMIARGGRLYDDWAKEIGTDHLRVAERSQEAPKQRPGRCVECHGWDYLGKSGPAARVNAPSAGALTGRVGGKVDDIVAILTTPPHGYGDFLAAEDLRDLAIFVAKGQVPMDAAIDPKNQYSKGWPPAGNVFVQTICANCHGNDGQGVVDARPLGDVARENPWQAMHTLLNGHPGGTMPALRVLDRAVLQDILAYVQGLPTRDLLASIVRGGRLYDTWWKENGKPAPEGAHPAYPGVLPKSIQARTTWRCKECHGWDYRGRDGSADGTEVRAPAKGIDGLAGTDPSTIAPKFTDATHAYARLLSPRDVLDLANFVSRGQLDMGEFIDRTTRKAKGDAARYAAHYQTICAACHGADGRAIRTMPPLGRIAVNEPWRALHGILNGHPGEPMPPLIALPREAASGILAYTQTLPAQR
ncbi:MAG: c-type cytochrome [Siculibacillus sp.]